MGRFGSYSLLLFSATLAGLARAQVKSGCKIQTLRDCGSDYVVYANTTRLPEGGEEFKSNCALYLKQIGCSLEFANDCLENLPKVVTTIAMNAAEEDFEAACTEGNERNELYKASIKCMNLAGAKLNSCIGGLFDGLQRAVVGAAREDIVHYSCCSYYSTLECAETALSSCSDPDSPAVEYVTNVMDRIFGQVLGLVCGSYSRGSNSCKELPQLPLLAANVPKASSLVELAVEIAASLRKN